MYRLGHLCKLDKHPEQAKHEEHPVDEGRGRGGNCHNLRCECCLGQRPGAIVATGEGDIRGLSNLTSRT